MRAKPRPKINITVTREWDEWDQCRLEVALRSHGVCEARTPDCPPGRHDAAHVHHVWPSDRRLKRHEPARCLHLCVAAHLYVHAHPTISRGEGWLLRYGDTGPVSDAVSGPS